MSSFREHLIVSILLVLALLLTSGCTSKEEEVVEAWEELAELVEDHQRDCEALAAELERFKADHEAVFSGDLEASYEKIQQEPELRVRMERVATRMDATPLECRQDAKVQEAAQALFGDLLGLE